MKVWEYESMGVKLFISEMESHCHQLLTDPHSHPLILSYSHTFFDFNKRRYTTIEMFWFMSRTQLNTYARETLGNDREEKSNYIDTFFQKFCCKLLCNYRII